MSMPTTSSPAWSPVTATSDRTVAGAPTRNERILLSVVSPYARVPLVAAAAGDDRAATPVAASAVATRPTRQRRAGREVFRTGDSRVRGGGYARSVRTDPACGSSRPRVAGMLRLMDTRTRRVEDIVPSTPGLLTMYAC